MASNSEVFLSWGQEQDPNVVYEYLNDLCDSSDFAALDEICAKIDPSFLDGNLALLIFTWGCKDKLPHRAGCFERFKTWTEANMENTEGLFVGLV